MKKIFTFVNCTSCGASIKEQEVDIAPRYYDSKEEFETSIWYCLGDASPHSKCHVCDNNKYE